VLDPGVPGPEPRGNTGSEFWRNRWDKPKRSPKLLRPVEVDVLVDCKGGVGSGSSLARFRREFRVDDLPRSPSLARVGDDAVDALEPCRRRGIPGPARAALDLTRADGDGKGVAKPWPPTSSIDDERKALTAEDSDPKALTELLTEGRGAGSASWLCFWGDDFWGLKYGISLIGHVGKEQLTDARGQTKVLASFDEANGRMWL